MRPVDVSIRHDDDLVVANLLKFESSFLISISNTGTDRSDHGLNFLILESTMKPGLLHVDHLTSKRQNRLSRPVATGLGRTPSGITLHNENFGFFWIALRAISEFSGKTATGQNRFPDCLTSLPRGLTSAGSIDRFIDHCFGEIRILVEIILETLVNDRANHSFNLGIDQLVFGLRAETRVRHFDADNADNPFPNIVSA